MKRNRGRLSSQQMREKIGVFLRLAIEGGVIYLFFSMLEKYVFSTTGQKEETFENGWVEGWWDGYENDCTTCDRDTAPVAPYLCDVDKDDYNTGFIMGRAARFQAAMDWGIKRKINNCRQMEKEEKKELTEGECFEGLKEEEKKAIKKYWLC